MDFIKILGGIALGATGAALYDALNIKSVGMGQGVITGGVGGGPGGFGGPAGPSGGGPGMVVGPPPGGGGGMGPGIVDFMPQGSGDGGVGPVVSVMPEIVGPGLPGGSFYGVNAAPWFWPLNVNWLYPQPPKTMICIESENDNDEKVIVCKESYQEQFVNQGAPTYAWGPSRGWL